MPSLKGKRSWAGKWCAIRVYLELFGKKIVPRYPTIFSQPTSRKSTWSCLQIWNPISSHRFESLACSSILPTSVTINLPMCFSLNIPILTYLRKICATFSGKSWFKEIPSSWRWIIPNSSGCRIPGTWDHTVSIWRSADRSFGRCVTLNYWCTECSKSSCFYNIRLNKVITKKNNFYK